MAFSNPLGPNDANSRFDMMVTTASEIAFAKQPIVESATDEVIGYCGVWPWHFEGERRFEFGYRLDRKARGQGYATEAGVALLEVAATTFAGTIYGIINPDNEPSMRVIDKLGFSYWKEATLDGLVFNLYRRSVGSGAGV